MAKENLKLNTAATQPRVGAQIRLRRKQLKMTLQDLGDATELSVGYLSQLERDNATPTLGTLARIARELRVGIDYFVATPGSKNALTRAAERTKFSIGASATLYERLGAEFPGSTLSSFILTIAPGYVSEAVTHEGEEIIFILEGQLTQFLGGDRIDMASGDSLHFHGNIAHSWANETDAPVRILWVGTLELLRARGDASGSGLGQQKAGAEVVDAAKMMRATKGGKSYSV